MTWVLSGLLITGCYPPSIGSMLLMEGANAATLSVPNHADDKDDDLELASEVLEKTKF